MLLTKLESADIPWKLLTVEAVLIVLSVLLALGVDSWREAREQRALAGRALQGFVDEARANCERIQATRQYHRAVVDGERVPHGMQVGLLRNDAWEVVKITGAAGWLDYDLVAVMSEISARQRDDLAISTLGRSFWILDDLAPIRQFDEDHAEATAHLYTPAVADILCLDGNRPAGRGENPPIGAVLYYTLAEAPDLDEQELTIDIVESSGETVRTLKSNAKTGPEGGGSGSAYALPAEQGLNRAVWDFDADPIEHELDDFVIASGGDKQIDGYTVAPGDYTVRLTLGETTSEQTLTVRFDPRQETDPDYLAEQQRLVQSAYDMLDEFQKTLIGLRQVREQAKIKHAIFEDNGETEKAEAMQAVVDAIDEWEDGNIATEREYFQDILNWPDRLFSELQFLYGTLDGALPRVTEGMKQRHADLKARFDDAVSARDTLLEGPVAEANQMNEDALVAPNIASADT